MSTCVRDLPPWLEEAAGRLFPRNPIMAKKVVKKAAVSKAKSAAKVAKKGTGAGMIGSRTIGRTVIG